MLIPVYLKSTTEGSALLAGLIELTPEEYSYRGQIDRTFRRFATRIESTKYALGRPHSIYQSEQSTTTKVHSVRLQIDDGPYGVPFATHLVPMSEYAEALAIWQQVELQRSASLVSSAVDYASRKDREIEQARE